ncbi:MAG: Ig-like domain-containing protein, partial [Lachnospiraceae bacterium]|nr:Ig-like domain-containing protein [Lachnospiraceae bacterium]
MYRERLKKTKKIMAFILCLTMVLASIAQPAIKAQAAPRAKTITLNIKSNVTMYRGTTKTIKVTSVSPKKASKKVKFKSSAPAVVKISSKGAMKALKAGKATITVTSASNKKVTKKVKVTVKNLVRNTTEDKVVIPLDKKKSFKMSLAVKATNLTFTSSKKNVATVDKKGVVKAKKAGIAKITVKGKKGVAKGAKQTVLVYVAKKSVKSVSLNAQRKVLNPGKTFTLKTKVNPKQAANVVTFRSSRPSVATVNSKGKVRAKKTGTARIIVTTVDGKKKAVCTIVVENKTSQSETTTEKPTEKPIEEPTEPAKPGEPTEKNTGNTTEHKTEVTTEKNTGNTSEHKTEATTEKNTGNTTEDKTEATTEKNTGNTTEDKTEAPTDNKYIQPSIEREVVGSQIKVSYYTEKLPDCDDTSSFEMLQIDFTDGKEKDEIILGEDVLEVPYKTSINPYQIAKYETSYNTWYEVYQWATKNGYTIANAGTEGGYGNVSPVGFTTDGGKPKFEKMPVCSLTWRDAMVWCNALNEMLGLEPV